jgi:hypothetical protein
MNEPELKPLPAMARWLRVSRRWLRDEAEAGRIPCVRAGAGYLFHAPTVEAVLTERAALPAPKGGDA